MTHDTSPFAGLPWAAEGGPQAPGAQRPGAALAGRRSLVVAVSAAAGALARPALAQPAPAPWPVRQTRLVVPFSAGSVLDIPRASWPTS